MQTLDRIQADQGTPTDAACTARGLLKQLQQSETYFWCVVSYHLFVLTDAFATAIQRLSARKLLVVWRPLSCSSSRRSHNLRQFRPRLPQSTLLRMPARSAPMPFKVCVAELLYTASRQTSAMSLLRLCPLSSALENVEPSHSLSPDCCRMPIPPIKYISKDFARWSLV